MRRPCVLGLPAHGGFVNIVALMKNFSVSTDPVSDVASRAGRSGRVSAKVLEILLPGLLGLITARGGISLA